MPNRFELIAVILSKDEVNHIADCVASLRDWVDAVIVWDSCTSDQVVELARDAGASVVRRPFDNFAAQRQAVELGTTADLSTRPIRWQTQAIQAPQAVHTLVVDLPATEPQVAARQSIAPARIAAGNDTQRRRQVPVAALTLRPIVNPGTRRRTQPGRSALAQPPIYRAARHRPSRPRAHHFFA